MRSVDRVAMISLHTSPLDQPGSGDAGGMNVYVLELSRRLAPRRASRSTSSPGRRRRPCRPVVEAVPGVMVRNIHAGPFEGLTKAELPGQLCTFAREVLRAEAGAAAGPLRRRALPLLAVRPGRRAGPRPLGRAARALHAHHGEGQEHALADGDTPEPAARVIGEEQVVEAADMLIANTDNEAKQLIDLYDADRRASRWSTPASTSTCSARATGARRGPPLGLPADAPVLLFAGRIQPLKAPDVLLRAVAVLLGATPRCARGWWCPSSAARQAPGSTTPSRWPGWPPSWGSPTSCVSSRRWRRPSWPLVRRGRPGRRAVLQRVLRPGGGRGAGHRHSGRRRGGGRPDHRRREGRSGLLVDSHDPRDWADALRRAGRTTPALRDRLAAVRWQARAFSWDAPPSGPWRSTPGRGRPCARPSRDLAWRRSGADASPRSART